MGVMGEAKGFHASREIKPKKCARCTCYREAWGHLMAIRDAIDEAEDYVMRLESRKIVYAYQDQLFNSAPYSRERILESACRVEDTPNCGVYFLIREDEIVYVGQSKNCPSRIQTHINDKGKVFDSYTFIATHSDNLDFLESWYIYAFNPKYNKNAPFAWRELVKIGTDYMAQKHGART
jgi:hypothetical protein